jgi:feruloyl esterase
MNTEDFKAFEAMLEWVEKGKAPERIIYSHREAGGATAGMGSPGKVYRTRPACAYPKVPRYKGSGDINDAANFACLSPDK